LEPLAQAIAEHSVHWTCPAVSWYWPASHISQRPVTELLYVPTLHEIHTPALAPPQPLRAEPSSAQPSHTVHALAPGAALKLPGGHTSQWVSEPVRGVPADGLPRAPAAHASHDVCPTSAWCVPSGHSVQTSAFAPLLNVPGTHVAQVRSDVTFGAPAVRRPAAHVACTVQKLLPAAAWNWPPSHALHSVASSASLYEPGLHGAQALCATNVPGVHVLQ